MSRKVCYECDYCGKDSNVGLHVIKIIECDVCHDGDVREKSELAFHACERCRLAQFPVNHRETVAQLTRMQEGRMELNLEYIIKRLRGGIA